MRHAMAKKTKASKKPDVTEGLTLLGSDVRKPSKQLETFPNLTPGRPYTVKLEFPEFTCVCPFSDFPDFATIRLEYIPNERCIELKSLKLYINSFRNVKIFHEHVINVILEDFVRSCDPLSVEVEGDFNVRGNIKTVVRATYRKQ